MTKPIVVVSTDLREPGDRVVELACTFALAMNATLKLVHVADVGTEPPGEAPTEVATAMEAMRTRLKRRTERLTRMLEHEVERLAKREIEAEAVLLSGRPWEALIAYCEQTKPFAVVVGAHAPRDNEIVRGALRERLLGSTADRVVRHAPCPVLVAPMQGAMTDDLRAKRWLVGVDASPPAIAALRVAHHAARDTGGELLIAHVVRSLDEAEIEDMESVEKILHEQQRTADLDALRDIARLDAPGAVIVSPKPHPDMSAAEALCHIAEEERAAVLCVGTHGRGALARVLIGSTAEKVLRYATLPVLVVRHSS